jgi:hypothetical protein
MTLKAFPTLLSVVINVILGAAKNLIPRSPHSKASALGSQLADRTRPPPIAPAITPPRSRSCWRRGRRAARRALNPSPAYIAAARHAIDMLRS